MIQKFVKLFHKGFQDNHEKIHTWFNAFKYALGSLPKLDASVNTEGEVMIFIPRSYKNES